MYSPLQAREQMPVYGMETLDIFHQKEVQCSFSNEKSSAHTVLLFARTSPKYFHERGMMINSAHYRKIIA
jgi:hypothetical protein